MADLDPGELFILENNKLAVERYKARYDFWKFMAGSVFAAIAIATIPASFQWATSKLETARKDRELSQSKVTFHETYIKDFVEKALNQDIEIRIRLAKYFADVSDDEYKPSWSNYLKTISDLRDQLRLEINDQERQLYLISQVDPPDQVKIAEIKRNLAWKYGELGYSEPNRDVVKDPRNLLPLSAQPDLVELEAFIYNFWKAKGLTDFQSAAAVGNFRAESNLDPSAKGGFEGGAFGLAQLYGARKSALLKYSNSKGVDLENIQTPILTRIKVELDYIFFEMQSGEKPSLVHLTSSTTLEEAENAFASYERWAGWEQGKAGDLPNHSHYRFAEESLAKAKAGVYDSFTDAGR